MQIHKIKLKYLFRIISLFLIIVFSSYLVLTLSGKDEIFIQKINQTFDSPKETTRYKLYVSTSKMIKQNLFFGVGPGNWPREIWKYGFYFDSFGDVFAHRPHNDFLWVFAEGGIFSFLSYILIFLILIKDAYILFKRTSNEDQLLFLFLLGTLFGYALISMLSFPLERVSHNIIFMIISAIIVAQKVQINVAQKESLTIYFKITLLAISVFIVFISYNRYSREIHIKNAMKNKTINHKTVIREVSAAYDSDYYDMDKGSTPLLWYRGLAYFNLKRYDLALQDFQQAYEVNPYHIHVINNLATCYGLNNEYDKAKELFEKCNSISPRFEEAALNLAVIYSREKRYEESLDVLLAAKNFKNNSYKFSKLENSAADSLAIVNFSDNYIYYFTKILNFYCDDLKDDKKIFNIAEGKMKFFRQLKIIAYLREKGYPYEEIIINSEL